MQKTFNAIVAGIMFALCLTGCKTESSSTASAPSQVDVSSNEDTITPTLEVEQLEDGLSQLWI